MSSWEKTWNDGRKWFLKLSPGSQWACVIGGVLIVMAVVKNMNSTPSMPYGYPPQQMSQPIMYQPVQYGQQPVAPYRPDGWSTMNTSGTFDPTGQNPVISVGGEVLTLP